jgi:hypothetical protein
VDRAGNVEPEGPAETSILVDMMPPAVTARPLPATVRGDFELTWDPVDLPAPPLAASGVAGTDVQISADGGEWADFALGVVESRVHISPRQGVRYRFRVRGVDRAGNIEPYGGVEAETFVDGAPPKVWFLPTSGLDRPQFTVEWRGADVSGVSQYDIQVRVDGGPWTDWVTHTSATSQLFTGEMGHIYAFRGRGTDGVGNVGQFPSQPQLNVIVAPAADLSHRLFVPAVHGSTPPGQPPR